MMYIAFTLLIGGGVGAVLLAISQSLNSAQDKSELVKLTTEKNAELKQQLLDLQIERTQLKDELEDRDKRIHVQQDKILNLSSQLVEKSDYITNFLTGGKGFPIITPSIIRTSNGSGKVTFTLANENELPLYDVVAVVFDWNYIEPRIEHSTNGSPPKLKQQDLIKSTMYRFDESQMFEKSNIISKDQFDLSDGLLWITLKCRSAVVHEKMAFVIEGGVVYQAFMVYNEKGEILKEWMPDGIPSTAREAIKKKFGRIPTNVSFTLTN